jgi:predicted alpha/beta hydrolase
MKAAELTLRCADGAQLPATLFVPESPARVLVMAAAMGVPRKVYRRFAEYLASRGTAVLSFDYRGIADAALAAADPAATRLEDWGRLDIDAALAHAALEFPALPLLLAGHSCGGQLPGLAANAGKLKGLVFVAASAPRLSHWRGAARLGIELTARVVIPLATLGRWFPARRLGFSTIDIPAGVMRQWGQWLRGGRYLFSPQFGLELSRYRALAIPALAFSFADDRSAPRHSVDALLAEYPALALTRRHVAPAEIGVPAIGHLGFFREVFRDTLWAQAADWISQVR